MSENCEIIGNSEKRDTEKGDDDTGVLKMSKREENVS